MNHDSVALRPSVNRLPSVGQVLLITGAILGLAFGYVGVYFGSVGVFLKPIASTFHWTRAQISGVSLISMLALSIGSPLVGWMSDRFGNRLVTAISILLFALGLFALSAQSGSLAIFGLTSIFVGFSGVATGPVGYLPTIARWFDGRLGLALSLAMTGIGLGSILSPGFAQLLVSHFGWRNAYRILALTALAGGAFAWSISGAGVKWQQANEIIRQPERDHRSTTTAGNIFAEWRFWLVAAVLFIIGAAALGSAINLVSMFTDRGLPPGRAAHVAGALGIGLMIGRLGTGYVMDRFFAPLVGAITFVLGAVGIFAIGENFTTAPALLAVFVFLLGLMIGAEGDFAAFVTRRYFGKEAFASVYGLLLGIYSLGGFAGPVLFSLDYDHHHNYEIVMRIAAIGVILSSASVLTLGRYRFQKDLNAP